MMLAWCAGGQASPVLDYQGRIAVDGMNFTGDGFFVFSLHDTNGGSFWTSGAMPAAGSTNQPRGVCRLAVNDGVYQVRLGDAAAAMPALDASPLVAAREPYLRVWFDDGQRGWRQVDDIPIRASLALAASREGASISGAQANAILRELRELRAQVQKMQSAPAAVPAEPRIVTVPLGDSPSLGRAEATVALVEFTDYQCPFCKQAHDNMLALFIKKYVDTGQARLVSRNYPLMLHSNAEPAANAVLCANAQKQFWAMRDWIFANNMALTTSNFLRAAADLKLDTNAFGVCFGATTFANQIARDKADAEAAGINATPTFVLGRVSGGKVTGTVLLGAKPMSYFDAEIPKLLAAAK